jgi:ubiquinone/menaquinone biosynthesis C-methylase UbiE
MFSNPIKNIEQAGITSGMKVADFGTGSGFYARTAAKLVGFDGKVYAIDLQKDLLTRVKQDAEREGIRNIEVIWGDVEKVSGTHLREGAVDFVILSNILFQVHSKDAVVKEAFRVLKGGGKVLVIEWSDAFGGLGPRSTDVVSKESTLALFQNNGFNLEKDIQAGEHHYGFIMKKG